MRKCEFCGEEVTADRFFDHLRYVHAARQLCCCGCGEEVKRSVHGIPAKFRPGHGHQNRRAAARARGALAALKSAMGLSDNGGG